MSTDAINTICEKLGIAAGKLTENVPKLTDYFIAKDVTGIIAYVVVIALVSAVLLKWYKHVKKGCNDYDDIFFDNMGFTLCFVFGAIAVCILTIAVFLCIRDIVLLNVSPDFRVIEKLAGMISAK